MIFNFLSVLSPFFILEIKHVQQQHNSAIKHPHITTKLIQDFTRISWVMSPLSFVILTWLFGIMVKFLLQNPHLNPMVLNPSKGLIIPYISMSCLSSLCKQIQAPLDLIPSVSALGYTEPKYGTKSFIILLLPLKPHLMSLAHIRHQKQADHLLQKSTASPNQAFLHS